MSGKHQTGPKSFITRLEEGILASILALMTLITFSQVVARYGFNTGWNGALEMTRVLFAWLILFGMSYGIKIGSHLGVDAFVNLLPQRLHRLCAIFAAIACILYASILFSADWLTALGVDTKGGAWFYWSKMYQLGIGLDDLHYPQFLQDAFGMQERVHRWVAYLVLPFGLVLFIFRCLQALVLIATGKQDLMIASHEAEDLVAENRNVLKDMEE